MLYSIDARDALALVALSFAKQPCALCDCMVLARRCSAFSFSAESILNVMCHYVLTQGTGSRYSRHAMTKCDYTMCSFWHTLTHGIVLRLAAYVNFDHQYA